MIPHSLKNRENNDKKSWGFLIRLFILLVLLAISFSFYQNKKAAHKNTFYKVKNSTSGNFLAARYALRNNDFENSYDYIKDSLRKDPDNLEFLNKGMHILINLGQTDEAKNLAERVITIDPEDVFAPLFLALTEIKKENFRKAENILIPVVKKNPQISNIQILAAHLVLVWLNVENNNYSNAILKLEKMEDKSFTYFIHYQTALISGLVGQNDRALKEFSFLTKDGTPKSYRLMQASLNFFDKNNKKELADQLYKSYINENAILAENVLIPRQSEPIISNSRDGIAELLGELGSFLYNNDLDNDALEYLQLAVYIRNDLSHAQYLIGNILSDIGKYKKANSIFEKIDPSSPFNWKGRINTAKNLYAIGEENQAKTMLLSMAEEYSRSYEALLLLAEIAVEEKKFEQAIKYYTKIIDRIESPKKEHWFIYYYRGVSYEQSSKWEKAESDFFKALELSPDNPEILNYLAYSWLNQDKNINKAMEMLEISIKQEPEKPHIIDSYGWALYKLEKYQEALKYIEKAVIMLPSDPIINDHLGDVYWQLGRRNEAIFQWKKALNLKPEIEDIISIKRKISEGIPTSKNEKTKENSTRKN